MKPKHARKIGASQPGGPANVSLDDLFDALRAQTWPKYVGDLSEAVGKLVEGKPNIIWHVADQDVVGAPAVKLMKRVLPICLHPDYAHGPEILHRLLSLFELDWGWAPKGLNRETTAAFYTADKTYRHFNGAYKVLLKARPRLVEMLGDSEPERRAVAALCLALLGEVAATFIQPVREAWEVEKDADAKLYLTLCLAWSAHYLDDSDSDRDRLLSAFESADERAKFLAAFQLASHKDSRVLPYILERIRQDAPLPASEGSRLDFDVIEGDLLALQNFMPERNAELLPVLDEMSRAGSEAATHGLCRLLLPKGVDLDALEGPAREFVERIIAGPDGLRRASQLLSVDTKRIRIWLAGPSVDEREFRVEGVTGSLHDFALADDSAARDALHSQLPDHAWLYSRHIKVIAWFARHPDFEPALTEVVRQQSAATHPRWSPDLFPVLTKLFIKAHGQLALAHLAKMASSLLTPAASQYFPAQPRYHLTLEKLLRVLRLNDWVPEEALADAVVRTWTAFYETLEPGGHRYRMPEGEGDWWSPTLRERIVFGLMQANTNERPLDHLIDAPTDANFAVAVKRLDRALEQLEPRSDSVADFVWVSMFLMVSSGWRRMAEAPELQARVLRAVVDRLLRQDGRTSDHGRRLLLAALTRAGKPGLDALSSFSSDGPQRLREFADACVVEAQNELVQRKAFEKRERARKRRQAKG